MPARVTQASRPEKKVLPRTLRLPVLKASDSAANALEVMRRQDCSGVVSTSGGRLHLYQAAGVVVTLADNPKAKLADVPATELRPTSPEELGFKLRDVASVAIGPAPRPGTATRSTNRPRRTATSKVALEVDRTLFKLLVSGPKDCYCRVDLKPVRGGTNGADCPHGHRGSVRCV